MYDYISLRVKAVPCNETVTDLVADALAGIGFESFEPDEEGVTAYIRKDLFNRSRTEKALADFPIATHFTFSEEIIEGEDWNKEWEQNYFKPISIDGQCVIKSSFHKDAPSAPLEILIDPKMAFGTGHHATTAGMVRLLLQTPLEGKSVIDMGTGTGILSILCKKRGASEVTAIEIDPFALENAEENGLLNNVRIKWICGDSSALEEVELSDLLLANINLNVIMEDFNLYFKKIKQGGYLFLSGFYAKDLPLITEKADQTGMIIEKKLVENEWVAIKLRKNR